MVSTRPRNHISTDLSQSETYIEEARKELASVSTEASKNITDLVNQTKNISLAPESSTSTDTANANQRSIPFDPSDPASFAAQPSDSTPTTSKPKDTPPAAVNELTSESLLNEAASLFTRFQSVTTSRLAPRLAQLAAVEDRADEAIERLGTGLRDFLRTSITVAPPSADDASGKRRFESKDAEGRRVVHATRFDAQLHVIHTQVQNFTSDPVDDEFASWKSSCDIQAKTEEIAKDLALYEELRRTMERLVPEQVEYKTFFTRYYFLRHVVETEERKRKELLKGMGKVDEEEIGWGDEDDETEIEEKEKNTTSAANEASTSSVSKAQTAKETQPESAGAGSTIPTIPSEHLQSTTTTTNAASSESLKPVAESRRSNEHSVADSDASYDILNSTTTSRGPGTPAPPILEGKEKEKTKSRSAEESDDDDWE